MRIFNLKNKSLYFNTLGNKKMTISIEHDNNEKILNVTPLADRSSNVVIDKSRDGSLLAIENFRENNVDESRARDMGLDYLTNETKRINPEPVEPENDMEGSNEYSEYTGTDLENGDLGYDDGPPMTFEEMQQQKAYYLSQLRRLEKKGHLPSRRLGQEHSLDEIRGEVFRIRKEIELDDGIRYCKQGLMFFVSTIEMLNEKFDPFGAKLTGWSNTVMATQESYDNVFEELYEKYSTTMKVAPEIKLISMIAGSAFMFHLQKTLIDKAVGSPDLMSSLSGLFGGGAGGDGRRNSQEEMKGPSINTEELLRKLSADELSDISSIVSEVSEIPPQAEKVINVNIPKKRGPKPKNPKK
jgi:hypothetical protein